MNRRRMSDAKVRTTFNRMYTSFEKCTFCVSRCTEIDRIRWRLADVVHDLHDKAHPGLCQDGDAKSMFLRITLLDARGDGLKNKMHK